MKKKILFSFLVIAFLGAVYWFSGISSTSLSSSVLSQTDDASPRITFTVDGQKDILIPPGKPLVFEWLSSNIDTLTVSHTTNNKKKCDNLPLNKDIKGTQGVYKHPGWAKNDKFIGCTYEITVEGKQTSTGAVVRESVKMRVIAHPSPQNPLVITHMTTDMGEILVEGDKVIPGQQLIIHYNSLLSGEHIILPYFFQNFISDSKRKSTIAQVSIYPEGRSRTFAPCYIGQPFGICLLETLQQAPKVQEKQVTFTVPTRETLCRFYENTTPYTINSVGYFVTTPNNKPCGKDINVRVSLSSIRSINDLTNTSQNFTHSPSVSLDIASE